MWKESFTHWLPIYINKEHFSRAKPMIARATADILNVKDFLVEDVMVVLPKLMSSMTVALMAGNLHASIKALEGYCWFHRTFLAYVHDEPSLQNRINRIIGDFIDSPNGRNKRAVAALGEFLPLLSVSDKYGWLDIRFPYILEHFDRYELFTHIETYRIDHQRVLSAHPAQFNK